MSNRSYPADFSRPLREVPVATDEDVRRMLERLRRRCKVGKVSVNDNSGEKLAESNQVGCEDLPDGAKTSPTAVAPIDAASSAGHPSPASASVVSGAAGLTATAGGGPHEAVPSSPPFQPTRPAPIENRRSPPLVEEHNGANRPALQWERISPTAMRTTCGTWTCCKVIVGGYPRYELWRRIAGLERPVCVKRGLTAFLEAQDLAEAESCV